MLNFQLHWHLQYCIEMIDDNVLFLSENDHVILPRHIYEDLNQAMTQQATLADYVMVAGDINSQVQRLQRIDQLLEQGLLSAPTLDYYYTPDISKPSTTIPLKHCTLHSLSHPQLSQQISQWLNIKPPCATHIVLVDDYLDPRILPLAKRFTQQQATWLLIKPGGKQPMLGPLFRPEKGKPCYQCLHSRLLYNNPLRQWLQYKKKAHPAVAQYYCRKHVAAQLQDWQGLNIDEYTLYRTKESTLETHTVTHLPQCHGCGTDLPLAPFKRQAINALSDDDGGYRQLTRQTLLTQLAPLLSPVTGLISALTEITQHHPGQLAIFRASYRQQGFYHTPISPDSFAQLSLGKGVNTEQAKASALAEAIERLAAQYRDDDTTVLSSAEQLQAEQQVLMPQMLSPFSQRQYQDFQQRQSTSLQQPQWVKPYTGKNAIHWLRGHCLSQTGTAYIPAAYCLANTPFNDQCYSLYTHNGNAAGSGYEEAILQGTLELIERDAAAIWWYNQIPRPKIDLSVIKAAAAKKIARTLEPTWHYWLLDISHDIDAVCCAAIGRHKETGQFMLGFGCHLDVSIAGTRALTEMYQLISIREQVSGPFDFRHITAQPFLFPKHNTVAKKSNDYQAVTNNINTAINQLIDSLGQQQISLYMVDYSRRDIPLKTVKMIAPGLCHFWPQFANKRLYQVPVNMQWLSEALYEDEFNPIALYL